MCPIVQRSTSSNPFQDLVISARCFSSTSTTTVRTSFERYIDDDRLTFLHCSRQQRRCWRLGPDRVRQIHVHWWTWSATTLSSMSGSLYLRTARTTKMENAPEPDTCRPPESEGTIGSKLGGYWAQTWVLRGAVFDVFP